jgi:molybdenum cofactor cytidylyltransferase
VIAAILAAGESKRFGGCKLLSLISGQPMILDVVEALPVQIDEVCVVTGFFHEELTAALTGRNVTLLYNQNYTQGLASSVALAARWAESKGSDLLLTLGDLPFVKPTDYNRLIRCFSKKVVFSRTHHSFGPPAIFPHSQLKKLNQVKGERGAKTLFKDQEIDLVDIPVAAKDIDRREDIFLYAISEKSLELRNHSLQSCKSKLGATITKIRV